MATDNSELSFVRCTSCRSLIPAVSARCRMCGANVQPQVSETSETKKSPRIRQKTVAISNGLAGLQVMEEEEKNKKNQKEEVVETPVVETKSNIEEIETDPISNYIEEIEAEPEEETSIFDEDLTEDSTLDNQEEDDSEASFNEAENFESILDDEEVSDTNNDLVNLAPDLDEVNVSEEENSASIVKKEEISKQEAKHFKLGGSSATPKFNVKKPQISEKESELKGFEEKEEFDTHRSSFNEVISTGVNNMEKEEILENGSKKLFGWLVSYATPEGKAIEIRESKFFITNKALKQNDLIINDRSVSTPHAMVHVTRSGGFLVQDLMSDRGMFIRRRGSDTYQKEESIVKCGHGDWLRVGDVEYLLTVVGDVGK